jgi:hypothetical protein
MRSRLVGRSAATADVFRSAADQPASDTIKAGPQRRPCRNAARQQGFIARCGLRCAGPTTGGTGDASADYHTPAATFASRRRARIDTGLIDTGIAVHSWLLSPGQTQHWLGFFICRESVTPKSRKLRRLSHCTSTNRRTSRRELFRSLEVKP